ncbi:MAG: 23S rRNA pseudouridine(2604) synthase RluF [Chitinophagales bacterium]
MKKTNEHSISLNKYVSSTGICSRRQADEWIAQGRVTINGEIGALGNRVFDRDVVQIDGETMRPKKKILYIAFNKPVGVVCTTEQKERNNIIDYINHSQRLFPIGRLDKPSQGLIFLTNDGDIVNKILRSGNNHEKEYIVVVKQVITPEFILKMRQGVPLDDTITKKCKVTKINEFTFKIILTQGLNRQIRRMCQYLGYNVTKLKRTRIMNVTVGSLKLGQWRELTPAEMQEMNQMISHSSKTEEASTGINRRKIKTSKRKRNAKNLPTAVEKERFVKPKVAAPKKSEKSAATNTSTTKKAAPKKKDSIASRPSKKRSRKKDKPKSSARPRRNKMASKKKNLDDPKKKK